ncbi:MAG: ribonuclease [Actinomycetota bacterium]|nr:ribonuclease [Actinomycetota bacterium]
MTDSEEPTSDDVQTSVPDLTPLTHPAEGVPVVVTDQAGLEAAIDAITAGTGPIAIDAERAGGYRYSHNAYLVQLRRTGSGSHLIDPIGFDDLQPLANVIADEEWILHAASQDLPCLAELKMVPNRLFDTEMAARILGRPKVGLAALAETELGVSLAKEHSAADWSTRPLPEAWLRYAALDVELLIELRSILAADLESSGRMPWAVEEFEHLRTAPARAPRVDPWRRTSGIHKVRTGRGLEIARQLWLARDAMAEQRDIAPGRVLPDAAISAAAIARPTAKEQLGALPAFSGRGTKRRIEYWWQAVDQANKTPERELPQAAAATTGPPPPRSWPDRAPEAAVRLAAARTFLTETAESLGMPTENLLTPDVARRLCWAPPDSQSVEAVSTFLSDHGARQWQIDLTCHGLSEALTPKESP